MTLRIGLTGGIGSGKSTVAGLLAARGAGVVDADAIAREVVEPGGPAYDAVVGRFGRGVLADDGTVDRAALAAVAFSDAQALSDLNAITHPVIGAVISERLASLDDASSTGAATPPAPPRPATSAPPPSAGLLAVAVAVIPLLRPAHVGALGLRAVVVVDCPTEVAVRRLVGTRGMDEADARARVAAQASRKDRLALADYVLDNGSTQEHLLVEVDRLWGWLEGLAEART
jgi:dephospho-CoA kinase